MEFPSEFVLSTRIIPSSSNSKKGRALEGTAEDKRYRF